MCTRHCDILEVWGIRTYQSKTLKSPGPFTLKTYQKKYCRFTPSRGGEYKILASNPAASEALCQLSKGIRRKFTIIKDKNKK